MSYSKETTIWCDRCEYEWVKFPTNRVGEARRQAREKKGWEASSEEDVCPDCQVYD